MIPLVRLAAFKFKKLAAPTASHALHVAPPSSDRRV